MNTVAPSAAPSTNRWRHEASGVREAADPSATPAADQGSDWYGLIRRGSDTNRSRISQHSLKSVDSHSVGPLPRDRRPVSVGSPLSKTEQPRWCKRSERSSKTVQGMQASWIMTYSFFSATGVRLQGRRKHPPSLRSGNVYGAYNVGLRSSLRRNQDT